MEVVFASADSYDAQTRPTGPILAEDCVMNPKSVRDLLVSLGLTAGLGSAAVACNKVGNAISFPDGASDTATDQDGASVTGAGGSSGTNGTADGGSAGGSGGQGGGGAGTGGAGGMGTGGVAGGNVTSNPPPPDGSWGFPDTSTVDTRTDVSDLNSDGHSDADSTDAKDAGG
jgi:hypothetical protein